MDEIEANHGNLKRAFSEQSDIVSLVTIIDIYCEYFANVRNIKEQILFLETLEFELAHHPDVVKDIGWDLPKALIKFCYFKNIAEVADMKSNPLFIHIQKCFDEINKYGNAKECLLTGCEILSNLNINEIHNEHFTDDITDDIYLDIPINHNEENLLSEYSLNCQFVLVMQLIKSSSAKIITLYPSKILGMVISAMAKFIKTNSESINDKTMIIETIFLFLESYKPCNIKNDTFRDLEISDDDYSLIKEEENVLQSKLLLTILTISIDTLFGKLESGIDVKYFDTLTENERFTKENYEVITLFALKICELANNMKLNLEDEFRRYVKESYDIYINISSTIQSNQSNSNELNEIIYQLSYTYELKKMSETKTIQLDPFGILILSGLTYYNIGNPVRMNLNISDALYIFIRCSSSALYSQTLNNPFAESVSRYWLLVALSQQSIEELKLQLSRVPKTIKNIFLQLMLIKNCNQPNSDVRLILFSVMTYVLALISETEAFEFIMDTLLNCPYTQAKVAMLSILKTLISKSSGSIETLIKLDIPKLGCLVEESVPLAPKLPPRSVILINEDRMASIHSLFSMCLNDCSKNEKDKAELMLLLSYLNMIIVLRKKWNNNLLHIVHQKVNELFKNIEVDGDIPELVFIQIANNTLNDYLNTLASTPIVT